MTRLLQERSDPEPHPGDDAEGALAADEQAGEVVAGVVLCEAVEPGDHAAVGEHGLQPDNLVAHHPVAHRLRPAGVGGRHAADRRGASRPVVDQELEPDRGQEPLERFERHASLDRDLTRHAVDRFDRGQPP